MQKTGEFQMVMRFTEDPTYEQLHLIAHLILHLNFTAGFDL